MAKNKNKHKPAVEQAVDAVTPAPIPEVPVEAATETPETVPTDVKEEVELPLPPKEPEAPVKAKKPSFLQNAQVKVEAGTEPAPKPLNKYDNQKAGKAPSIVSDFAGAHTPANPSALTWPTDPWGLTTQVKAAVLEAIGRVNGQEDKKELLDMTLEIAMSFVEAKFKKDAATRAALIAASKEAEEA